MANYQCCVCDNGILEGEQATSKLDPCALFLVSNIDQPRENHKEQQFYCHFECFRRIVNNDGLMYIMEEDFPTVGEIAEDEDNCDDDDDGRA